MTVVVGTPVTFATADFDVGTKSLNGVVAVDFDTTGMAAGEHCGVAMNRRGNRVDGGGAVGGANRLWWEAEGVFVNSAGDVFVEMWFQSLSCRPEFVSVKVGSVGANKRWRLTHTTTGTSRSWTVHALSALGGTLGTLLASGSGETGANNDMRSTFFSPFSTSGGVTFQCTRKD